MGAGLTDRFLTDGGLGGYGLHLVLHIIWLKVAHLLKAATIFQTRIAICPLL